MCKFEENFRKFIDEKSVEISTILEFVDLIGKYTNWIKKKKNYCNCTFVENKNNCAKKKVQLFYRGESKDFGDSKLTAGAFRSLSSHHYDYNNKLKDYRREIVHTLSDREIRFIKSVSQHHGLETSLVDISSNAFIALFFALKNSKDSTKDSYVYTFEDYIDISDLFYKHGDEISVLDELRTMENKQFIKDLFKTFNKSIYFCYIKEKSRNLLEILYKSCPHFDDIENKFNHIILDTLGIFLTTIGTPDEKKQIVEIWKEHNQIIPDEKRDPDANKIIYSHTKLYMLLLTLYLQKYYKDPNKFLNKKCDIIPNLFLNPAIPFERINLQQGAFFAQQYISNSVDDKIYLMQHIKHSRVIIINGDSNRDSNGDPKRDIIKDLDNILNINIGTIFGDRDSIASYINNKK